MKINSFYTVFVTSDMNKMLQRFSKTGSLKILHDFETDRFKYWVMVDNSGNNTDFIQFKDKKIDDSFYAVRMNTDDFDKMLAILFENGFSVENEIVDTESFQLALLVSKNKEPNILLFGSKK